MVVADQDIASITTQIYALLGPCSSEDRARIVNAVFALLGDPVLGGSRGREVPLGIEEPHAQHPETATFLGPRATGWARQHKLTREHLESVYYFHDGDVEIHINSVPGESKREQTRNCYLLVGLRVFLASDSMSFSENEAIGLCKHTQAYDKNNHTKHRNGLGNLVNGSKERGFELAGPGLRAAGELVATFKRKDS